MKNYVRAAVFSFMASTFCASFVAEATAQDELRAKETHRDWSVFVDEEAPEKYCYAASVPTSWEAFRGDSPQTDVRRGSPYLLVSTFPSASVTNEISVRMGFPIDPNQNVTLAIGQRTFDLFAEGQEAWLATPSEDAAVIAAMRAGATATITATSTRGTRIIDEYSLLGFTASIEAVERECR